MRFVVRLAIEGGPSSECKWRVAATDFLRTKLGEAVIKSMKDKLVYTQILDLAGIHGPRCARQRSLINMFACMPQVQPLAKTMGVLDITQGPDRCALRIDGSVPVAVTGTVYFSFQACRDLTVVEMGELMGHRMSEVDVATTSETSFRTLLGNSVHVCSMGMFLSGMVGTIALQAAG